MPAACLCSRVLRPFSLVLFTHCKCSQCLDYHLYHPSLVFSPYSRLVDNVKLLEGKKKSTKQGSTQSVPACPAVNSSNVKLVVRCKSCFSPLPLSLLSCHTLSGEFSAAFLLPPQRSGEASVDNGRENADSSQLCRRF